MKRAALFSFILHIGLLVLFLVGLPVPSRQVPVNEHPIIMEFEKIGPVSKAPTLTPDASKEDKKKLKKPEPKKALPKEESIKKEEPEKIEAKPTPPQEKPAKEKSVEEDAGPLPIPKKKPEPKKEPKKPEPKKPPKKDEPKTAKAEVNLTPKKTKPKPLATEKKKSVDDIVDSLIDDSLSDGAQKGAPAMEVGHDITATDIDAIRQKIYKCWLVPIGAKEGKDHIVDVTMEIAKDGTVTKADVVNKDRMSDPYFQAAAESAQRAVLDPACNPLPLPPESYEKWKRLTLRFNPKDMY